MNIKINWINWILYNLIIDIILIIYNSLTMTNVNIYGI